MSKTTSRVDSVASPGDASGLQRRVLILAPFGCDASIVWQVLCAAGLEAEICAGVEEACAEIRRGAAAVVVAEEALADQARQRITAALADEPAWSDLPLLILGSHVRPGGDGWPVLKAIEGTTYLVVLDRPLHTSTLVSAVRVAVESRRRQYQVRDELAARRRAEDDLHRLNESLEQQVAERTAVAEQRAHGLQRLAAELNEAEHRERQRLAKLLHNDLQQLLLAVKLRLPVLMECPRDELEQHVARIDQLLAECLSTSRNLTHELSPRCFRSGR
jgi:signal transduction histidine kinase